MLPRPRVWRGAALQYCSSVGWQQAAPANVCRCYQGPVSGGEPLCNAAALQVGSKRLPRTSADVTKAQCLEGSRFAILQLCRLAASGSRERLEMLPRPSVWRGAALQCCSSVGWQQAAPANVCRCYQGPVSTAFGDGTSAVVSGSRLLSHF